VSTIRTGFARALACALLASAIAVPAATAGPLDEERYLSTYGPPAALDSEAAAAEAAEQYYASYGPPAAPSDEPDGTPWLPFVLPALVVALAAGAVATTRVRRRHHAARRTAHVAV
jgi:hypothetical protein